MDHNIPGENLKMQSLPRINLRLYKTVQCCNVEFLNWEFAFEDLTISGEHFL